MVPKLELTLQKTNQLLRKFSLVLIFFSLLTILYLQTEWQGKITTKSGSHFYDYDYDSNLEENEMPSMEIFSPRDAEGQLLAPQLLSPSNYTIVTDSTLVLKWNVSTGAILYRVEVAENSEFLAPIINTTTSFTNFTTGTLSETSYYWRIRTQNVSLVWGNYSDIWQFTVFSFQMEFSETMGDSGPPDYIPEMWEQKITWIGHERMESYDLYASANPFNEITGDVRILETNRTTEPFEHFNLFPGGLYYAKLKGYYGNESVFSNTLIFSSTDYGIQTPSLISPNDSSTFLTSTVDLQWQSVDVGYDYEFQVAHSPTFTILEYNASLPYLYEQHLTNLTVGTYYWRVRAFDYYGHESSWSTTFSFDIEPDFENFYIDSQNTLNESLIFRGTEVIFNLSVANSNIGSLDSVWYQLDSGESQHVNNSEIYNHYTAEFPVVWNFTTGWHSIRIYSNTTLGVEKWEDLFFFSLEINDSTPNLNSSLASWSVQDGVVILIYQKSPIQINSTNGGYIWFAVVWEIFSLHEMIANINELIVAAPDTFQTIQFNSTQTVSDWYYYRKYEMGPSVDQRRYNITVELTNGMKMSNSLDLYTEFYSTVWNEVENEVSPVNFIYPDIETHLLIHSTREVNSDIQIEIFNTSGGLIFSNLMHSESYFAYLLVKGFGIYGSNDTSRFGSSPDRIADLSIPLSDIGTIKVSYKSEYHPSNQTVFDWPTKQILSPTPFILNITDGFDFFYVIPVMESNSTHLSGLDAIYNTTTSLETLYWNDHWVIFAYNESEVSSIDYNPEYFDGFQTFNFQSDEDLYFAANVGSKGKIYNATGTTDFGSNILFQRPNFGDYIRGFDITSDGSIYFFDDYNAIYRVVNGREIYLGSTPSSIQWLTIDQNDTIFLSMGGCVYEFSETQLLRRYNFSDSIKHFVFLNNGSLILTLDSDDFVIYRSSLTPPPSPPVDNTPPNITITHYDGDWIWEGNDYAIGGILTDADSGPAYFNLYYTDIFGFWTGESSMVVPPDGTLTYIPSQFYSAPITIYYYLIGTDNDGNIIYSNVTHMFLDEAEAQANAFAFQIIRLDVTPPEINVVQYDGSEIFEGTNYGIQAELFDSDSGPATFNLVYTDLEGSWVSAVTISLPNDGSVTYIPCDSYLISTVIYFYLIGTDQQGNTIYSNITHTFSDEMTAQLNAFKFEIIEEPNLEINLTISSWIEYEEAWTPPRDYYVLEWNQILDAGSYDLYTSTQFITEINESVTLYAGNIPNSLPLSYELGILPLGDYYFLIRVYIESMPYLSNCVYIHSLNNMSDRGDNNPPSLSVFSWSGINITQGENYQIDAEASEVESILEFFTIYYKIEGSSWATASSQDFSMIGPNQWGGVIQIATSSFLVQSRIEFYLAAGDVENNVIYSNFTHFFTSISAVQATPYHCLILPNIYAPTDVFLTSTAENPDLDGVFTLNWGASENTQMYRLFWKESPDFTTNPTLETENVISFDPSVTGFTFADEFESGHYYFVIAAENEYGQNFSPSLYVFVNCSTEVPIPEENEYIRILFPVNHSVVDHLFEIPLEFELHGFDSIQEIHYRLSEGHTWEAISGNTTFDVFAKTSYALQLRITFYNGSYFYSAISNFTVAFVDRLDYLLNITISPLLTNLNPGQQYFTTIVLKNIGPISVSKMVLIFTAQSSTVPINLDNQFFEIPNLESEDSFSLTVNFVYIEGLSAIEIQFSLYFDQYIDNVSLMLDLDDNSNTSNTSSTTSSSSTTTSDPDSPDDEDLFVNFTISVDFSPGLLAATVMIPIFLHYFEKRRKNPVN
ncbi:MAG: hypothetical protein ACTSYI_08605 [Promethearchaeota archaeon]